MKHCWTGRSQSTYAKKIHWEYRIHSELRRYWNNWEFLIVKFHKLLMTQSKYYVPLLTLSLTPLKIYHKTFVILSTLTILVSTQLLPLQV